MNSIAAEQLKTLKISIYRYDPDVGNKPYMPVSYTHLTLPTTPYV